MPSITRVLHPKTWVYFSTSDLSRRFCRSSIAVHDTIVTDINDLVQEFWRISSDVDVGVSSFFAMRELFCILERCCNIVKVRYDVIFVLRLLST